ncbi:hypothetical protein FACS1894200_07650 [Spirochaetia bacterium]|nr:hypothetical protein FACS1894200_07650 [Spirochaetia bacterium]
MKTIAINGSPRKGWNTHILVEEARKGAVLMLIHKFFNLCYT